MAAFQSYAGAYDFRGRAVRWRCYATARLHEVRHGEHAPLPKPPPGQKWISPSTSRLEPRVAVLVDQEVDEVAQILLQFEVCRP